MPTAVNSPLSQQAMVRPKKGVTGRRILLSSLMLTSLVDAFSILVIFILMSAKSGMEIVRVPDADKLPAAQQMRAMEPAIVLSVKNGQYEVDSKPVRADRLSEVLRQSREKFLRGQSAKTEAPVLVQADRQLSFSEISPVLIASSEAGLSRLQFAVIEATAKR